MSYIVTPQVADSAAVSALCRTLRHTYPFLHTTVIGYSVCGRSIPALSIGNGPHAVLFAAAFHAQEWLTSLVCLRLCEEVCRIASGEQTHHGFTAEALQQRTVVFVPQVNPDGVDIAVHGSKAAASHAEWVHILGADIQGYWQANARGIDLNHNFDAGREALRRIECEHGHTGPSARQWGGTSAESEPESKALCDLCRRVAFSHVVALHSQGEEIYWQYGDHTPPHARMVARMMGAMSGYTPATPSVTASHAGFKDWFIEKTGRMGLTVELGRGKNPLPMSDLDPVYEKARDMLLFTAFL